MCNAMGSIATSYFSCVQFIMLRQQFIMLRVIILFIFTVLIILVSIVNSVTVYCTLLLLKL